MRALTVLCSVVIFAGAVGGCAAISGLDKLEKVDCTDDCEGGIGDDAANDVTVGSDAHIDGPGNETGDGTMGDDSSPESGSEASRDGGSDAPSDAPADAPIDAPRDTGPVDCGTPNTITNCAACGNVCDTTNSNTPSCNGTTCSYASCVAGHSNCNQTAPDLLGCECATPACCSGNMCQTTHSNGVGQSFFDCLPLDTYNQTQALAACTAFTGNQATCMPFGCLAQDGGPSGNVVCGSNSTNCVCWQYDAPFAGRYFNMAGVSNCFCPGSINAFQWH